MGVLSTLEEDWSRCKDPPDDVFIRRLIQNCHENPYFEAVACKPSTSTSPLMGRKSSRAPCSCPPTASCCCIYSVPTPLVTSSSRPGSALSSLPSGLYHHGHHHQHLHHQASSSSRTVQQQYDRFRIRHFAGTVCDLFQ